ncbi:MAG: hypothetical protein K9I29_06610 [Bacteroidales bacterium]|nr:hypothetical protein [Bacteroidales bacterium]
MVKYQYTGNDVTEGVVYYRPKRVDYNDVWECFGDFDIQNIKRIPNLRSER